MINAVMSIANRVLQVPDTSDYFILGYGVVFIGILLYVLSLVFRFSQTQKEIKHVRDLEKDKLQSKQDEEKPVQPFDG